MGFGDGAMEKVVSHADKWKLGNERVCPTSSYIYLGIPFNPTLDLMESVRQRADKGMATFGSLYCVLACKSIPLQIKCRLVKTCIIPILSYGGELWGMNEERTKVVQGVLNKVLRVMAGLGVRSNSTSSITLSLELDIPTMAAVVASLRTRAFLKYPTSRTIIGLLCNNIPTNRKRTWVTGTRVLIQKYCLGQEEHSPSIVFNVQMKRAEMRNPKPISLTNYKDNGFWETKKMVKLGVLYSGSSKGLLYLVKIRVGAFWWAPRFCQIKWLDPYFRNRCPCCLQNCAENLEHFLFDCESWAQSRKIIQVLTDFVAQLLGTNVDTWNSDQKKIAAILLIGGSTVLTIDNDIDFKISIPHWTGNFRNNDNIIFNGDGKFKLFDSDKWYPAFYLVSKFLQEVIPLRIGLISPLIQSFRADANQLGMAALVHDYEQAHVRIDDFD